ncbi:MAG: hypothetical protein SFW09_10820 [Hyphomicrobiaceae bacterium]|nr:hypothetical protein [Hyphomicrobiaceae bacterium]
MMFGSTRGAGAQTECLPTMVRRIALGLLAVLLGGAGYLIAVRGEAMVVDLAALAGRVWCF